MGSDVWPRVQRVLRDRLEPAPTPREFSMDVRLREDLGLSSLTVVDLIVAVEDEFDLSISDDELPSLVTLRDVVEAIEHKIASSGGE